MNSVKKAELKTASKVKKAQAGTKIKKSDMIPPKPLSNPWGNASMIKDLIRQRKGKVNKTAAVGKTQKNIGSSSTEDSIAKKVTKNASKMMYKNPKTGYQYKKDGGNVKKAQRGGIAPKDALNAAMNNINGKPGPFNLIDSQTGAVYTDRTLGGDIARQVVRRLECQPPAFSVGFQGFQLYGFFRPALAASLDFFFVGAVPTE